MANDKDLPTVQELLRRVGFVMLESTTSADLNAEQPSPVENASEPIWDLVIADMRERDRVGRERYGTPLQAFNGRDSLVDAYQEQLDHVVYLRQEIRERDEREAAARSRLVESTRQSMAAEGLTLDEQAFLATLRGGEKRLAAVPRRLVGTLAVNRADLHALLDDISLLQRQVTELQQANNRLLAERRESINARVREFYVVAEQPMPERLGVPGDDAVRFRVRLVVEEALELVESVFTDRWAGPTARRTSPHARLRAYRDGIMKLVADAAIEVDLPAFADACADIDHVVEGARIAFGIDGEPIMAVVHAANLAKQGGPIRESDGKRLKPPGWLPPDVAGALRKQGWQG